LFADGKLTALCFDSTGERIATGADSGVMRVWDVPAPPIPVPTWFPAFAEAVAGTRLSALGNVELLSREELETARQQLAQMHADDFYARLARWLLADPAQRPARPF